MSLYIEVKPEEIDLRNLLAEMSSLITERSLYYMPFTEWKKAFKEKNPSVKNLSSKRRKIVYDTYYIPFYNEYVAGDYNCKIVSTKEAYKLPF